MNLPYDPAENEKFWRAVRQIPGFPAQDDIPLKTLFFESGAIFRLPEMLAALGLGPQMPLLVVMDRTPMKRGAESLKPLVLQVLRQAGFTVEALALDPDETGQVHTDMRQIDTVKACLAAGKGRRYYGGALAMGSGVVTDITKHACHLFTQETGQTLPFVVFPTANSVSAYTSNMAPTFVDGVKRTLDSRYPDALVCDLETLVDAPRDMTAAGVGDMLAIYTSLPDWRLAHALGMDDSYSPLPEALLGDLYAALEAHVDQIRTPTPAGMAVLAKLITLGGLAMSLSHATTPLSGYEHVMSHVLDLMNEVRQAPLAQHGSQVALAAVLVAEAYEFFLREFDPAQVNLERCFPELPAMERAVRGAFAGLDPSGKAGQECWNDYAVKLARWREQRPAVEGFLSSWPQVKAELQALTRPASSLKAMLARIEAPTSFTDLPTPFTPAELRFAFLNAPLIRRRLTLGDALIFFGWDREGLWERILARAGV